MTPSTHIFEEIRAFSSTVSHWAGSLGKSSTTRSLGERAPGGAQPVVSFDSLEEIAVPPIDLGQYLLGGLQLHLDVKVSKN